jgi:RHS repeat-associated protein
VNYIYDAANRLVNVEDDATQTVIAEYYYDPFGRRLWKDVGGVRTYFFYSEEGLIAEYDANGNEIRSYGYKPDSTWTTDPLWLKQGGTYYWYQNDHLGTPQKLTAQDGTVVWSAQYTAFGEADVQVETVTNNLRFPGQYADAETGLYYNFQRYYDPRIGRYLQVDPIGFAGGDFNLYGYVRNNPGNESDPLGMASITEIEDGDLFYTWHMGWIDIHHATHTDGSLIEAWEKIKNASPGEVVPFTLSISQPLQRSTADFCLVVKPESRLRKHQLLYAWMLITYQFEAFQGWGFFDNETFNKIVGGLMKSRIDQVPSSFSTEDLVSNLIFFYAVVDAKETRGKIVRKMAENLINILAGRFNEGAKDERIISTAIWLYSLKAQSGYMVWRPQYFNDEEFLNRDLSQWDIGIDSSTPLRSIPPGLDLRYYYYDIGRQAQQLLPKYRRKYGIPTFPNYFTRYFPMNDGYISIKQKNEFTL